MGRPLSDLERNVLMKSPDVAGITREHIFLKDGKTIDPQTYDATRVAGYKLIYRVLKHVNCRKALKDHEACDCEWCTDPCPRLGEHLVMEIPLAVSPFGRVYEASWRMPNGFCDGINTWAVEEEMSKQEAESMGIFKKTKVLKAVLASKLIELR